MTARVALDRRRRVLIVNGFVDGREMYVDFLQHQNLQVRGAARPAAALRILRGFRPNVIVTDFAFPEGRVDGVTFINVVRQQPDLHDAIVIVVSGFTQPADEQRARARQAPMRFSSSLVSPNGFSLRCGESWLDGRLPLCLEECGHSRGSGEVRQRGTAAAHEAAVLDGGCPVANAVYFLCAVTSAACAILLFRMYWRHRSRVTPLTFWTSLAFAWFAVSNALVFTDLVVLETVDLAVARAATACLAGASLLLGLIWEAE